MQELLDKWNIKLDYKVLLSMWNEPQRYYHTQNHLIDLIDQINEVKKYLDSHKDYEKLILCALFHDCIYDPANSNNEQESADFFLRCCQEKNQDTKHIYHMILDTKSHESNDRLSQMFSHFDMSVVEKNLQDLLVWENLISQEYQILDKEVYKVGRIQFLESLLDKYPNNSSNLLELIQWVRNNY